MPQKKAAAKAHRQDVRREERNRAIRKRIKDIRKKTERLITAKKVDEAKAAVRDLQKLLGKASRTGHFLNKNTAGRYLSRITKKINAVAKK